MEEISVLRICVTCRRDRTLEVADGDRDGARLYRELETEADALAAKGVRLEEVRCLSGCKRACTAVLSGAGKWSYVLCEIDPDADPAALIDYAERFARTEDGQVPWRERPESLRRKTLARIPPLETRQPSEKVKAA